MDENQEQIVLAFRALGASVQSLSSIGNGCPDLLVGYRGGNYVVEVKDGSKAPSRRALTNDQKVWHDEWNGSVDIVQSDDDVLTLVIELARK